jgi:hypothetical protein
VLAPFSAFTFTPNPALTPIYSNAVKKGLPTMKEKASKQGNTVVVSINKNLEASKDVNRYALRNTINGVIGSKMVAIVSQSVKGNIMLKTIKVTAKKLLEKKALWLPALKGHHIEAVKEPTDWIKLVAHGIPTEYDLTEFKAECAEFNDVETVGPCKWLNPAN